MTDAISIESIRKDFFLKKSKYRMRSVVKDSVRTFIPFLKPHKDKSKAFSALKDINLQIAPGTALGIIGRNGSGKSTLLKILAGVLYPTSGRAEMHGKLASILELGFGFHQGKTLRENYFAYGQMMGCSRNLLLHHFDEVVSFADVDAFLDIPLKQCQGNALIRLAFSMIVHLDFDIILADEILAVGDNQFQKSCLDKIRECTQKGLTVLFVSHDMKAIRDICTRVIRLDAGEIVDDGPPDLVTQKYEDFLHQSRLGPEDSTTPLTFLGSRLISHHGLESGKAEQHQPFQIEFLLNCRRDIDNISFKGEIYNKLNIALRLDSELDPLMENQKYSLCFDIPANLLAETQYLTRFSITYHTKGEQRNLKVDDALNFEVYNIEPELSARGDWTDPMLGAVCPKLEWLAHDCSHPEYDEESRAYLNWKKEHPRGKYFDFYVNTIRTEYFEQQKLHPTLGKSERDPAEFAKEGLYVKELIERFGLKSSSKVIDYGCGSLRTGQHFIRHLDQGHYLGLDVTDLFYKDGGELLDQDLLLKKSPQFMVISPESIEQAAAFQADHVFSFQVFVHIPVYEAKLFFANLATLLGNDPEHRAIVGFTEGRIYENFRARCWKYPRIMLESLAREQGMKIDFEAIDDQNVNFNGDDQRRISLMILSPKA